MKKIFAAVCIALCIVTFAACGAQKEETKLTGELKDILDGVYEGVGVEKDSPYSLMDVDMTAEDAEFWTGLTESEYSQSVEKGIVRQYEVTAISEGTVLLKLKNADEVKSVFDKITSRLTLNKFGCLPAEQGVVITSGNYILMIFGSSEVNDYFYSTGELTDSFTAKAGVIGYTFTKN